MQLTPKLVAHGGGEYYHDESYLYGFRWLTAGIVGVVASGFFFGLCPISNPRPR